MNVLSKLKSRQQGILLPSIPFDGTFFNSCIPDMSFPFPNKVHNDLSSPFISPISRLIIQLILSVYLNVIYNWKNVNVCSTNSDLTPRGKQKTFIRSPTIYIYFYCVHTAYHVSHSCQLVSLNHSEYKMLLKCGVSSEYKIAFLIAIISHFQKQQISFFRLATDDVIHKSEQRMSFVLFIWCLFERKDMPCTQKINATSSLLSFLHILCK
ncbi:unnamed protein product [Orchesella dallaii]|uniref:Uncharacterized protein n=1 Tax=Orchesella dallaii TaxID=48710 RepID=A0ABP1QFD9_9HEXA